MRIGVLSDSHWRWGDPLPSVVELLRVLKVDGIIHCGDLGDLKLLEELEKIAPVEIVAGNCDSGYLREKYGRRRVVPLGGILVGLVHGNGYGGSDPLQILQDFAEDRVQVIAFGHTHQPFNEQIGDTLLFNPGSCTIPRGEAVKPSFGLLHIYSAPSEANPLKSNLNTGKPINKLVNKLVIEGKIIYLQ